MPKKRKDGCNFGLGGEVRFFEEVATVVVCEILPGCTHERTRDAIQIHFGGDKGISVLLTPESLEIRLPTLAWTRSHHAVESSRLFRKFRLQKLRETGGLTEWSPTVHAALMAGIEKRAREFRSCRFCKLSLPRELMLLPQKVCYDCAEQHLGVIF
jgi:hypothetical protein